MYRSHADIYLCRLSKNSTPRSYVQYLEDRVRQLEGKVESEKSPEEQLPQGGDGPRDPSQAGTHTDSPEGASKRPNKPDLTVLQELGTHVIDEDGFSRYMGPSSGIGFSAQVLQEVVDEVSDESFKSFVSLSRPSFIDTFRLCRTSRKTRLVSPYRCADVTVRSTDVVQTMRCSVWMTSIAAMH